MILLLPVLAGGRAGSEEAACDTKDRHGPDGTSLVVCQASTSSTTPGTYRPSRPAARYRTRTPTPEVVNLPAIAFDPSVGLCRLRTTDTVLRSDLEAMSEDDIDPLWLRLTSKYPRCPSGQVDPEDEVVTALERVPLPAPAPHIAPGWAITGKPGFLEPNLPVPPVAGKPTLTDTRTTRLGVMSMTATAVYRVDWGDDAGTGPHAGPGGPWPAGDITHFWTDTGTYDVVVTAEWTVDWRMGAAAGRLTTTTEGTIADFRVEQLQAVRNR